jgi:hypothetical protein
VVFSPSNTHQPWVFFQNPLSNTLPLPQVNGVKLLDQDGEKPNMYHFYQRYLRAFGELLTDMERIGIKVDTKVHLKQVRCVLNPLSVYYNVYETHSHFVVHVY